MKRAKVPTSSSKADVSITDLFLDDIEYGRRALRAELEVIVESKENDSKYDKASRIAHVMDRITSSAERARKIEDARRKRTNELTLVQVIAWLRQQTEEDRGRVARELHALEKRGGVLG